MLVFSIRKLCSGSSKVLEDEFKLIRDKFVKLESLRESIVDPDHLTENEKVIHRAHKAAVEKWHFTYNDPFDGSKVYTRYRHSLIGLCCGTACRHCIFNHCNAPEMIRTNKRFNTSFWTDKDSKNAVLELFKDLKKTGKIIRKPIF